mgnify:CR=1 FL=1
MLCWKKSAVGNDGDHDFSFPPRTIELTEKDVLPPGEAHVPVDYRDCLAWPDDARFEMRVPIAVLSVMLPDPLGDHLPQKRNHISLHTVVPVLLDHDTSCCSPDVDRDDARVDPRIPNYFHNLARYIIETFAAVCRECYPFLHTFIMPVPGKRLKRLADSVTNSALLYFCPMAAYSPMSVEEFRKRAHELADWMADFLGSVEERPVRAQVEPGEIAAQLPEAPPESGESFDVLMNDFKEIVLPGITHWQHPAFFAYFPANSSYPSVLAEMLTATLGAQGMIWQTSPAATEMEERVMDWIRQMIGLPGGFQGVIQDTASTSTLCALLTAREKVTGYRINEEGFYVDQRLTVYASSQTHSSIEKGAKIAGFGRAGVRAIDVDEQFALRPDRLEEQLDRDIRDGLTPTCVVATIGTTGSTAIDPLKEIARICQKRAIWLHVDAALAGSAMVLPQLRWMQDGVEGVDSYVFNPHKWMFTNFDSSAYFVKDPEALKRTFEIHPEYLRTKEGRLVNNYRDWGIQLGRRFRSLKLWFVIRTYGVEGIRKVIETHLELAQWVREQVEEEKDFELMAPVRLNTVCLRYLPHALAAVDEVNLLNERILEAVNQTGKAYFTHTKLNGRYTIRFMVGQTYTEFRHVEAGWKLLRETARSMK